MKRSLLVLGGTVAIACSTILPAQTPAPYANPLIGTWKQNMDKSMYSPGPPPPRGVGSVRQYASGDDGSIVAVTFNIDAQGLPSLGAVAAANYDGKEYAQHTIATLATSLGSHIGPKIERTIAYKPVNQYTVEITQRQDGRVVNISTRTISRDGKTLTERVDFMDPVRGERINNVLVFEKQ
jgi:hypothetical protein